MVEGVGPALTAAQALLALAAIFGFGLLALLLLRRFLAAPTQRSSRPPWIGPDVWPELAPPARRAMGQLVRDPELVDARPSDRARAPRLPTDDAPGAIGAHHEQRRRLLSLPGRGEIASPVWPVCCERLCMLRVRQIERASLAALEDRVGSLDDAYLEQEIESWGAHGWRELLALIRSGEHTGGGLNAFHCQSCGALYIACCAP